MRGLLLATLLTPVLATAAPSISLFPAQPEPGQPFRIEVTDSWPRGCAPSAGASWVDGQDIVLQLKDPADCKSKAVEVQTVASAEPGESRLIAERGGVYRIRVEGGKDSGVLAFALAEVGAPRPLPRPESGLWWPEAGGEFETSGPGLGVQIELQGQTLALNVSGYRDSGRPTWWFAAAPLQGRAQHLELTSLRGGSGPFADYTAPEQVEPAGSVYIEWISAARAVFWFVRPGEDGAGLELRPISMARFAFGVRPGESWVGEWIVLSRDESGAARSEVIRFARWSALDDGFELRSEDGLNALICDAATGRPDSPPRDCQLRRSDAGVSAAFSSVGLNRLDGRLDQGGGEISLLRVEAER